MYIYLVFCVGCCSYFWELWVFICGNWSVRDWERRIKVIVDEGGDEIGGLFLCILSYERGFE